MPTVILKTRHEKALHRRHPWIFSGAVAKVDGLPQPGETVEVVDASGNWLARGAYSPRSQMVVRVWTFAPEEEVTPRFFYERLQRAMASRADMIENADYTACRMVNAEADGLPGLIVDRYGDFAICQFLTAGTEYWRDTIVDAIGKLLPVQGIYERSDADVRKKEGLDQRTGVLSGSTPPDLLEIREGKNRFFVDVMHGHKTGFYLDQRENRAILARYAPDATVLNCFAYTGGFAISALNAGAARAVNIDSSANALEMARQNAELNQIDASVMENIRGDVMSVLRHFRDTQKKFDVIVLDPPKFAQSRARIDRASRGYKDINLLAFNLLASGGMLFTFSCSGLVSRDLFEKIVAGAALDAGCDARIIGWLSQASDHPSAVNFPEGAYLKGLICKI